jgi:Fe2+ or Zn2+ uptake regulation protein
MSAQEKTKTQAMEPKFHYATVSEAIEKLRAQGFIHDFTLEGNEFVCDKGRFSTDHFEIMDIYRYEGDTDPADEAMVYALESDIGLKGILVTGYGVSSDNEVMEVLNTLSVHKQ